MLSCVTRSSFMRGKGHVQAPGLGKAQPMPRACCSLDKMLTSCVLPSSERLFFQVPESERAAQCTVLYKLLCRAQRSLSTTPVAERAYGFARSFMLARRDSADRIMPSSSKLVNTSV